MPLEHHWLIEKNKRTISTSYGLVIYLQDFTVFFLCLISWKNTNQKAETIIIQKVLFDMDQSKLVFVYCHYINPKLSLDEDAHTLQYPYE